MSDRCGAARPPYAPYALYISLRSVANGEGTFPYFPCYIPGVPLQSIVSLPRALSINSLAMSGGGLHEVQTGSGRLANKVAIVTGTIPPTPRAAVIRAYHLTTQPKQAPPQASASRPSESSSMKAPKSSPPTSMNPASKKPTNPPPTPTSPW